MPLQPFALGESVDKLADKLLLVGGQGGRVDRVNSREITFGQRIGFAAAAHGAGGVVNLVQVVPPLHAEIRVAGNGPRFQLEEQQGHGFVHPGVALLHGRHSLDPRVKVGHPAFVLGAGVIGGGKPLQPAQADAVAGFQQVDVAIGQRSFQHREDAHRAAGRRPHPDNVMVAPLDIDIMVHKKLVKDAVRPRAAVIKIAQDVQLVNGKVLDDFTEPDDIGVGPLIPQDGVNDLAVIQILVMILKVGVQQFVQNIAAVGGQAAAHIGAGVFA